MNRDQVFEMMVDAIVEVMDRDRAEVTAEARFVEDLKGDSLSVLEVLEILQEKLDIDLPTEAFDGVHTVGGAVDVIMKILTKKEEPE